jgi:hypothetical protein
VDCPVQGRYQEAVWNHRSRTFAETGIWYEWKVDGERTFCCGYHAEACKAVIENAEEAVGHEIKSPVPGTPGVSLYMREES